MKMGEKLAWYRAKAKHTQESLAHASGISRKRISEIELGKGSPSLDTVEALLRACNASLSDFFGSEVPQSIDNTERREIYEKIELLLKTPGDAHFVERLIGAVFKDAIDAGKKPDTSIVAEEPPKLSSVPKTINFVGHDMPQPAVFVKVPYYDRIPAGTPEQLAFEQKFYFDILHSSAKPGWYALKVSGDSMLPEYRNGDIVLMDHDQAPKDGDIVAALIDESEATLKVFSRNGDEIVLTPLNKKKFKVQKYHASRVTIQGVLVELVRRSPKRKR
jgi:SOS-response transcriptional repressor LexA